MSWSDWLALQTHETIEHFLDGLSDQSLLALPWIFEMWALPHQVPPTGDWAVWLIMGGRGAGKTRAGSEWVRSLVEGAVADAPGRYRRIALIGETYDQVRDVMIFGESGILVTSPPDRRPKWMATERKLVWPNGAEAYAHSATSPEALRGPQFDAAWCDELAKWSDGQSAWDNLQFTLRLGEKPRQLITTTPRNVALLRNILARDDVAITQAPTEANKANLAEGFVEKVVADYGGTRLGRQEIAGELLDAIEGSLWPAERFDVIRKPAPELDRIVVAVDPPVTGHKGSDACGIVVAGIQASEVEIDRKVYVLEDATITSASPDQWAELVVKLVKQWSADRVVAEVNQGGDLVEALLRQKAPNLPYRAVRATRGKIVRAEPVAALYEQGRVCHSGRLDALEDQMAEMTRNGFVGVGSPDRVDALVWAITDLVLDERSFPRPRVRRV
ncbi:MAG: terminase family protein [Pseudomonadota bacterium]